MKVRSRKLYEYLLQAGVLNGPDESIAQCKKDFRKQYKKLWKQRKKPRKEIRFELSLKEFQALQLQARVYDLRHTTYARQIVLASVEQSPFIPYRDVLHKVLQLISMAAIASGKGGVTMEELSAWLMQAETELLHYLQHAH
jgi:hypothetical protein